MPVILLDPRRPSLIPLQAIGLVDAGVRFTEEVPEATRMHLPEVAGSDVLVSTDREHESVRRRIESGDTVIAVPTVPGDDLSEAVEVMDRLWSYRGWEVTQTHKSLAHYLVEETYEVVDAIEVDDADALREELGDLLLQVLFHSRIAAANGRFDVDDVASTLVAKLVHRSPHLADDVVGPIDIAEQERAWEARKAAEKARTSTMDGIAVSQPAVGLARKVIDRAGLPEDSVPDQVSAGIAAVAEAEGRLRTAVTALMDSIRAAEKAAAREREESEWRGHLS
ncbi:MazG family protein [Rhodococcus sp. NPDC058521]|uniref:MazG family protein n=1 Tax=Rhodococcus sp. NPDC058521 TaxID=3346536 RepID=UPI00365E4727